MIPVTDRAVLAEIEAYVHEYGLPPTLRELAARCGIGLTATRNYLLRLDAAGALTFMPGTARGIVLSRSVTNVQGT